MPADFGMALENQSFHQQMNTTSQMSLMAPSHHLHSDTKSQHHPPSKKKSAEETQSGVVAGAASSCVGRIKVGNGEVVGEEGGWSLRNSGYMFKQNSHSKVYEI